MKQSRKIIFFKIALNIFILFSLISNSSGLTLDEIYEDIKSFPIEKLILSNEMKKERLEKLKAIQIFVLPEKDKWDTLFMKFKKGGANTLIVRVFHNRDDRYHCKIRSDFKEGVYFHSKSLPVIDDILKDFTDKAKGYGFKVFAWMTTRYANYGRDDLKPVNSYSFEKNEFVLAKGIDCFDKYNQEFIKLVFREIARYPIDGILLQDDLFYRHNEGFSESLDEEFNKLAGFKPTPQKLYIKKGKNITYTDLFYKWREFKSEKIADFINELRNAVKKVNPDIKLAVNLTYEAISNPKGALSWLAHNIYGLKCSADYFSIMVYHRQIMEELNMDFSKVKNYIANMLNKCKDIFPNESERLIFKLQIKDWKTNEPIADDEILEIVNYLKEDRDLSIALVPYPPDISEKVMQSIFK